MQFYRQTFEEDKSVQKEFHLAYCAFVQSFPRRADNEEFSWVREHHRCDADCECFHFKNLSICKKTGNWHYCSSETCDRTIRTSELLVCQISGATYDLDLVMDPTGIHHGNEDHDDIGASSAARRMDPGKDEHEYQEASKDDEMEVDFELDFEEDDIKVKKEADDESYLSITAEEQLKLLRQNQHKRVKIDITHENESNVDVEEEEEQGVPQSAPISIEERLAKVGVEEHHARKDVTLKLLSKIFKHYSQQEQQLFHVIASNVERLWLLIHCSSLFQATKKRYQLEYHVLVVVHHMCGGYSPLGKEVITQSPFVHCHLPQVRDLKFKLSNGPVKVKNFTAASKIFKLSFIDLLQNHLELVQHRLTWIYSSSTPTPL